MDPKKQEAKLVALVDFRTCYHYTDIIQSILEARNAYYRNCLLYTSDAADE